MPVMIHMGMENTNDAEIVRMHFINDAMNAGLDGAQIAMTTRIKRPEMRKRTQTIKGSTQHRGVSIRLLLAPSLISLKPYFAQI